MILQYPGGGVWWLFVLRHWSCFFF